MSSSKYDVVSQKLEELLSPSSTAFEVPRFQRRFSWGTEEIDELFEDIFSNVPKDELPYFLGSIVLAKREGAEESDAAVILDGQQRITTISLIIAALIEKLKEHDAEEAGYCRIYLYSHRHKGTKPPKLTLQEFDQKCYEALLQTPASASDTKWKAAPLANAMRRILQRIDEYAAILGGPDIVSGFQKMKDRLLYDVEIVKIRTLTEKDAFRLFETLNDRGLDLNAADLIKNKLLSHCGKEIDDAFEAWANMISTVRTDDVVNYLRYFWIAEKSFVRKRGLYDSYKTSINSMDSTAATVFAIELAESAIHYDHIVNPIRKKCPWGEDVADILDRLNTFRARACRSALLACAKIRPSDMTLIANLAEAITVRYSIVGERNPNQLEDLYATICDAIRQSKNQGKLNLNPEIFSQIPNDLDFISKLSAMQITASPTWRELLWRVNAKSGTGETKIGRVNIEHILPQTPRAIVLSECGITKEQAQTLCYRIGNLTLLAGRKNSEASNKPFSEKQITYKSSEIKMTSSLVGVKKWTKDEIENRSKHIAEILANIYPHPSTYL